MVDVLSLSAESASLLMLSMPQSLSHVIVHFVFSTKNRHQWLSPKIQPSLYAYMATVSKDIDCHVYRMGGVEDHVHVAILLARTVTQANWIEHVKTGSTRWLKKSYPECASFAWQRGYGAFSISPTHLEALKAYISGQAEHHQKESFQEEYRRLLKKYGVAFDERYVWD